MLGEIFEEFCLERNLSKSSIESYKYSLKDYCKYNNMNLDELINEADNEEEKKVRSKNRKIVKRLKQYRIYKIKNNSSPNTIKNNYGKIRTFYRHWGIEIPYIPPTKIKTDFHERYSDIPTREHIQEALEGTNNLKHKALILFMSSSGTALKETISLKISDFLKATKKYYKSIKIEHILDELYPQKDIVPIFEMVRFKTNYPYYTCCSPEATTAIIKYLQNSRKDLKQGENLFKLSKRGILEVFTRINDKQQWGKTGNRIFFHTHALRKFNATAIEDIGLANTIQGRKPDQIVEAYFKKDPKRIKEKYIEHLPKLTINETKTYSIKTDEYKTLEKELKAKDTKQKELEERLAVQEEQNRKIMELINKR